MARLIIKFKERILKVQPLPRNRIFSIGRRPDNDLVIDNLAISGHHARIEARAEGYVIVDLQSKNGTFLNGEPIREAILQHQDTVMAGKHTLLVDLTDSLAVDETIQAPDNPSETAAAFNDNKTMTMKAPRPHPMRDEEPPPPAGDYPEADQLTVLAGGEGDMAVSQKPITIGRNKDADLVITGLWGLLAGSPAAIISKQAGDVLLRFSGGLIKPKRNGTGIKGTIKLNHEDIVDVGPVRVQIQLSRRSSV